MASCDACPTGEYQPYPKATECVWCPAGTAAEEEASISCTECFPGTAARNHSDTCLKCVEGTVSPDAGAEVCFACDPNSVSNEEGSLCLCNEGFAAKYEINVGTGNTETVCTECPVGAVCDFRGAVWDTLATQVGYWRASQDDYYRCILPSQCSGGPEAGDSQCAEFRTGPLCAICMEGYTASSTDGTCEACETDSNALVFTSIVVVGAMIVMFCQYYFVLWTSKPLLDAAAIEDQLMSGSCTLTEKAYKVVSHMRYGRFLTTEGPPAPRPEGLYKLKILLTFLQILTNLSLTLQIDYPRVYLEFVNTFNPANLDFVAFTSADCISSAVDYYLELYVWLGLPVFLIGLLVVFFYLPVFCKKGADSAAKKRRRREFWRLVMFTLFLVFPSLSNKIFSVFVCINVEGVDYLVADFEQYCYDEKWNAVSYVAFGGIAAYPIGIPAFFFYNLYSYRFGKIDRKNRLQEKGVRAQLGFLYDCYETRMWWFELVDMIHKLTMTSLIAFFPWEWQLPMGTVVLLIYLVFLLHFNPYIRKGDDALHLLAQVELILLMMAGNCFKNAIVVDEEMDWVMSIVLITMISLFLGWFCSSVWSIVKKMLQGSNAKFAQKMRKCCRIKDADKKRELTAENHIIGPQYFYDRQKITSATQRIQMHVPGANQFAFGGMNTSSKSKSPKPESNLKRKQRLAAAHARSKSSAALSMAANPFGDQDNDIEAFRVQGKKALAPTRKAKQAEETPVKQEEVKEEAEEATAETQGGGETELTTLSPQTDEASSKEAKEKGEVTAESTLLDSTASTS
jgi:hypothetical protein